MLHVNGQVLVCARADTTYELGAERNSWRARFPGALQPEFLKKQAGSPARKEGGARNVSLPSLQLGRVLLHQGRWSKGTAVTFTRSWW